MEKARRKNKGLQTWTCYNPLPKERIADRHKLVLLIVMFRLIQYIATVSATLRTMPNENWIIRLRLKRDQRTYIIYRAVIAATEM